MTPLPFLWNLHFQEVSEEEDVNLVRVVGMDELERRKRTILANTVKEGLIYFCFLWLLRR
jgi:hypothetical protein